MFEPVRGKPDFPSLEKTIAALWRDRGTYQQSLEQAQWGEAVRILRGPPDGQRHAASGALPDTDDQGSLSAVSDDARRILRSGRLAGTPHGLPVEVEVCKELGIHSKAEIEAYGVEPFIHKCQESVWRYMKEWEDAHRTDRILDRSLRRLRHLPPELRGERVVGAG